MSVSAANLTVAIPVYESVNHLRACLEALTAGTLKPAEIIVVDDCSPTQSAAIAELSARHDCLYIRMEANSGPAAARNAAAYAAHTDLLLFLDADTIPHSDVVEKTAAAFHERPELHALFGSYDDAPLHPSAVSQFRNLLHHYVHQRSAGPASTFWAGCGAVRRNAFLAVGGFDETYRRPSIEDVEFGARLHHNGCNIELDPSIQVTHAKHWTFTRFFWTDLTERAIPWMELGLRHRGWPEGLNFERTHMLSVALAGLVPVAAATRLPLWALAFAALIFLLNIPLYRFAVGRLGWTALPVVLATHLAHYIAAALGALAGVFTYAARRDRWAVPAALAFLAIGAGLLWFSGAPAGDFSGYPDEPAHFVNGLLLRQWLDNPFRNPAAFAAEYYLHYPKVTLGHWPPLGYLMLGTWMHAFGATRESAMVFVLLFAATSAWLIYELLWSHTGSFVAFAGGVAWLCARHVQPSWQQIMLDVVYLPFLLLATACFREYARRPALAPAALFGLFAGLALLIKQNAVVLAFVPVAYVILGRRFDLLRRRDFWAAAAVTAIVAGPWYAVTMPMFYQKAAAWSGLVGSGHGGGSAVKPDLLWSYAGLPVAVLSGIVWLTTLVRRCPAPWVLWASLLTGVGATTLTLQILTEPRYLLAGIAAQIALTCLAISFIRQRALRYAAAVVMIALMFGVTPAPGPDYNHVASTMAARLTGPVLLASEFEGAIIAAAAASHPDTEGAGYWLRATKLLGDLTWGGAVRRLYVRNNSDVDSLLRQNGVNQVFLDVPARGYEPPHTRLLRRTLAEQASLWDVEPLPVRGGTALLYRRRAPVPAQKLSVYVNRLGRRLDAR